MAPPFPGRPFFSIFPAFALFFLCRAGGDTCRPRATRGGDRCRRQATVMPVRKHGWSARNAKTLPFPCDSAEYGRFGMESAPFALLSPVVSEPRG